MLRVSLALLALAAVLPAIDLPKPERIPESPTTAQVALIREGVALHDKQDYTAAIAKYRQVLEENPWEVNALHELAFTYFASKDYRSSLGTAQLGAECKSLNLPSFYELMASALDELGRRTEAVDVYRAAVAIDPGVARVHYNLAVALYRDGKAAEAKAAVQQALRCDPNRASSHAQLAVIYQEMGYRLPAILAYSRFLELEPSSPRASGVRETLQALLQQGVGRGKKDNEINIVMPQPSRARVDEGDFRSAELMLSVLTAAKMMSKSKTLSPFEELTAIYSCLGEAFGNVESREGFAVNYYAPYFAGLSRQGYTEAFTAEAWQGGGVKGASDWSDAHKTKLADFREWSQAYRWPRE